MTENPAEKAPEDPIKKAIEETIEELNWKQYDNDSDEELFSFYDLRRFSTSLLKRFSEEERRIEKERILKKIEEKIQERMKQLEHTIDWTDTKMDREPWTNKEWIAHCVDMSCRNLQIIIDQIKIFKDEYGD